MSETEFLVLRLYGPLAAWGDIAVGEVRPVRIHPTKSALIGLMGAALGIRREDTSMIKQMADSYGFAVCDEGRKVHLRDFHTVQSAPQNKMKEFGTGYLMNRQRELSIPKRELGTILTYRDYICDVIYTVAVWIKHGETAPFSLEQIRSGLREPVFVPYLGRKSCVLSRPMEPQIIHANNPLDALQKAIFYGDSAKYAFEGKLYVYRRIGVSEDRSGMVLFEGDWDVQSITEEVVRDEPLSRIAWQFGNRKVKRSAFCRSEA